MAQQLYDRKAEDLGNLVGLEHVNLRIDNQALASEFYLSALGLTRDPFMHRLDIHAATGLPPHVTAEHEGRLVDDIVLEWAQRHGHPYALELTGPAGGAWGTGGGERLSLDALEFCRLVSGRGERSGLLATSVPF